MPYLSIIIPIFNGEKYINSILSSIIDSNNNFLSYLEIILIDDGSTDKSYELCKFYSEKYSFITAYHKENGGIASARNYGLSKAHGEYVTFCDQDDQLVQGYQSFIKKIKQEKCDVLISNFNEKKAGHIVRKGNILKEETIDRDRIEKILLYLIGEGELLSLAELHKLKLPDIPPSIWNGIYRKEMIDKNHITFRRFVDYEDDWLFIISNLFVAQRLYVSDDAYYCWTINLQSESHTRKYIPDFFQKRTALYQWVDNIVFQLPVLNKRIQYYQNKVITQTALWGFYNACHLPLSEYICEMKNIKYFYGNKISYKFKIGRLSNFYLFLLKNQNYKLAYFVNNFTFRRSYH